MRKILTIASIILGIVVIAIIGYFAWQYIAKKSVTTGPENGLEQQAEIKALPMAEERIFDYWINKATEEIYYIADNDSQIFKISSSGEKSDTGSKAIGNLSYIKPSSDGSKALIAFGYPNITFALYDTNAKNWLALPAGTTAASWHPNSSNQLAYLRDNGLTSRLFILDLSTGKTSEILRLSQKDLDLDWPDPNIIYFKERASSQIASSVWAFNLKNKSFRRMTEDFGLIIKWLNKTTALKLGSGFLTLINSDDKILTLLDMISLPTKCTSTEQVSEIYCAAPDFSDVSQNFITSLPDVYLKTGAYLKDTLYLLPIEAAGLISIFDVKIPITNKTSNNEPIDAVHLEIASGKLYFLNRYDSKLYGVEL